MFSLKNEEPLRGLAKVAVPFGNLLISHDYDFYVSSQEHCSVVLIGYCFDLESPGRNEQWIADKLASHAARNGAKDVAKSADYLLGRFIAIIKDADGIIAFGDATAMRTMYYADDRPLLSSHASLIGDIIGEKPQVDVFRHFQFALPGDKAAVPGVRLLPANFQLDVKARTPSRFWPHQERIEKRQDQIQEAISGLLRLSAGVIAGRWDPALSLTAGFDSRVSLAAYRGHLNTTTFTYFREEKDHVDVTVAKRLAHAVGLHHRVLKPVSRHSMPEMHAQIDEMHEYTHDIRVPAIYLKYFSDGNFVHARSNLLEIGRCFWRSHSTSKPARFDAEEWTAAGLRKSGYNLPKRDEARQTLISEMKSFFDMAGYNLNGIENPELLGYDAWDLVYWEHRMSTWHAQILLASDIAIDTATIFNSRAFLALLLALPVSDRANGTALHAFISEQAPELMDIPINPKRKTDFALKQIARGKRGMRKAFEWIQRTKTRQFG